MAKCDFIPDSYKNLHDWSANYSGGVGVVATQTGWLTASVTTLKSQLHDDTPAPASQTMQAREYMAMGVIADEEIGNPSNIASAVFQS